MGYKWCIVPQCTNTSIRTPEKLFINVPKNTKMRRKWLQLARRNPNEIAAASSVFCCEDHFNLETDMENYLQYKMGFSQRIIMVKGVLPSKFHCQEDRRKRLSDASTTREAYHKRQKLELVDELVEDTHSTNKNVTGTTQNVDDEVDVLQENKELEPIGLSKTLDRAIQTEAIATAEKCVQIAHKVHFRSKAVQTLTMTRDISTSPIVPTTTSSYTSPFKISSLNRKLFELDVATTKKKISFLEEKSDSDVSLYTESQDPPIFSTSSSQVSNSGSTDTETNVDVEKIQRLQITLRNIVKKPMLYIGISKECYFIIQLIHKHTNILPEHILLCLKKIRLNSTFSELEDNFGISLSYGSKLFLTNIPLIASALRPFIVDLDRKLIKQTLPISFRHNYYNISCIIDCLEIDIQKPSKAIHQALTWSDYKKANTIKYLISCTPNGLINYISPGFGGRTSDITVIENCNFLDKLEPGTFILADRGFKHVELLLSEKGIKLLRPPSVTAGSKLSKAEVRQTKIIASLRIHIKRVIRRIREFHMLKQHSVINTNTLRVLDDVILIASALVNLQNSLIK